MFILSFFLVFGKASFSGSFDESGGPLALLANFYNIDPAHMIVIHDELDIDFGVLRVEFGGGDNGLKSIRQSIGSGDHARIRIRIRVARPGANPSTTSSSSPSAPPSDATCRPMSRKLPTPSRV